MALGVVTFVRCVERFGAACTRDIVDCDFAIEVAGRLANPNLHSKLVLIIAESAVHVPFM